MPSKRVGPADRLCSDGEKRHPIEHVNVTVRNGNYSAFHGYRFTPSDYSEVRCLACGSYWRSNARWVDTCADASREQTLAANPGGDL